MTASNSLPFIDEHEIRLDAPEAAGWDALVRLLRRQSGKSSALARVLGCVPVQGTPRFGGRPGETLPGFEVTEAEPGRRLALAGRHRFARYALIFVLDEGCLRARTFAEFPGLRGRLYRAAVLGSGAHSLITRRLLRRVARAAQRRLP